MTRAVRSPDSPEDAQHRGERAPIRAESAVSIDEVSDDAPLDLMLFSYQKTAHRFMGGGDRPTILNLLIRAHLREADRFDDPFQHRVSVGDLYAAVGDAVRWARAIDLRLSKDVAAGADWWKPIENGELIPGTRFIRNAVEHDWAQALELEGLDTLTRAGVKHVCWASVEGSRTTGRRYYDEHMVGERVLLTLLALNVVLLNGALIVESK